MVPGGAAEVPDVRIAVAGQKRIARELVARPLADHGAGGVTDVVLVERKQRSQARLGERGARARKTVVVQPPQIDALLEVDLAASRRLPPPVPAVLRVDVVRAHDARLRTPAFLCHAASCRAILADARLEFVPLQIWGCMSETLVSHSRLTEFTAACLEKLGLASADARLIAETLVASNLRGVDSHGVVRLPHYATRLRNGTVKPRPQIGVRRNSPSPPPREGEPRRGRLLTPPPANETT